MSAMTAGDFMESLTGFDEIAIAQRFGRTVSDLAQNDATMFTRSLVFVAKRREGASDDDAWQAALGLPMKEVSIFFTEPAEEDSGKGEPSERQPESSLSSVS